MLLFIQMLNSISHWCCHHNYKKNVECYDRNNFMRVLTIIFLIFCVAVFIGTVSLAVAPLLSMLKTKLGGTCCESKKNCICDGLVEGYKILGWYPIYLVMFGLELYIPLYGHYRLFNKITNIAPKITYIILSLIFLPIPLFFNGILGWSWMAINDRTVIGFCTMSNYAELMSLSCHTIGFITFGLLLIVINIVVYFIYTIGPMILKICRYKKLDSDDYTPLV
jgi:hypothetical protein